MTTIESRLESALGAPMAEASRLAIDARMQAAIAARPPKRRHWPIRRGLVLGLILAALSTVAAGAAIMSTEDPFGLADPAEFAEELEAAKAVVPLPPGREWPAFLASDPTIGGYSRGGGRSWVEGVAMCEWFDEWLDARAADDAPRAAAAAGVIAEIPTWETWDSLFWDQSVRDHYGPVIASVAAGRTELAEAEMTTNCRWLADE